VTRETTDTPGVRKYAMTRIAKGDYLLPSNDAQTLWRIYTYEEDGSAIGLKGTFWATAKRPMPDENALTEDVLGWSDWQMWAGPFRSRKDALESVG
jgi:hypothetical protein